MVMAALDAAIQGIKPQHLDGRVKPGHDSTSQAQERQ
jgi:hypothetical protein